MQTVTIELTDNNSLKALQDLEHKHLIRIVKEPDPIAISDFLLVLGFSILAVNIMNYKI